MEVGECDRGDRGVFWQRQEEVGSVVVVVDKPQLSAAHHSLLTQTSWSGLSLATYCPTAALLILLLWNFLETNPETSGSRPIWGKLPPQVGFVAKRPNAEPTDI